MAHFASFLLLTAMCSLLIVGKPQYGAASSANPSVGSSCSGALPDFLLHHTGDDLGHPVYREDREGVPPRANPEVPTSMPDSLQELLPNCQQAGVQPTVPTGVPTLH